LDYLRRRQSLLGHHFGGLRLRKGDFLGKEHRYLSIMLVGEHGRIVALRHFKAIAIGVLALTFISLLALAAIGYMYIQQSRSLEKVQEKVDQLQQYANRLKDEKDILQAKWVVHELKNSPATEASAIKEPTAPVPSNPAPPTVPPADEKSVKKAQAKPDVKWQADISRFSAGYDSRSERLELKFRVHNRSKPRQTLNGRVVAMFMSKKNPFPKPVVLPSVPIVAGVPTGSTGYDFSVNNYRTLELNMLVKNMSTAIETVTVYVFTQEAELLLTRDFTVDMQPAAAGAAPIAKPSQRAPVEPAAPLQAPSVAVPAVPAGDVPPTKLDISAQESAVAPSQPEGGPEAAAAETVTVVPTASEPSFPSTPQPTSEGKQQ
jgi:hypothetical protein